MWDIRIVYLCTFQIMEYIEVELLHRKVTKSSLVLVRVLKSFGSPATRRDATLPSGGREQ